MNIVEHQEHGKLFTSCWQKGELKMNMFDWLGIIGVVSIIAFVIVTCFLAGDQYQERINNTTWANPPVIDKVVIEK